MDLGWLVRHRRLEKLGDHAAIWILGRLPQAEDVGVANDRRRQVVALVEGVAISLPGKLRHGVRAQKIDRIFLGDRQVARIAIDRARRGVDDAARLKIPGGKQHVQRAANVDLVVVSGVPGRENDVARRAVNDDVAAVKRLANDRKVGDAALDDLE